MLDIMPLWEACAIVGIAALMIALVVGLTTSGRIWFYRRYRYDYDSYVKRHQRQMARDARRWNREHAKLQAKGMRT
ncbi:MAG: hypothetical protein HIU92_12000 [Proteobacteria bacterium]|nr:hypothetical protein [Pseudomonadota bacterium]